MKLFELDEKICLSGDIRVSAWDAEEREARVWEVSRYYEDLDWASDAEWERFPEFFGKREVREVRVGKDGVLFIELEPIS